MRTKTCARGLAWLLAAAAGWAQPAIAIGVQQPSPAQSAIERASERIRALQREAGALAKQEKSLLGDLRRLEIERRIQVEEAARADAELKRCSSQVRL